MYTTTQNYLYIIISLRLILVSFFAVMYIGRVLIRVVLEIREKKMNGLEGPMVFNTFTVWE